eukprot:s1743_g2.t1
MEEWGGNYRFVFVNSSPIGLTHHATDAGRPPQIRYRTALELEDIPASRAEDEGFWMMLVVTAVQPCSDGLALYDKHLGICWDSSYFNNRLSFAAVKASGIIEVEAANGDQDGWGQREEMAIAKAKSMTVLTQAQKAVADIEAAIERKPRPYGFEDASILPLLDLLQGADEAPAEDWGLHPFFERLLRRLSRSLHRGL